MAFAPVPGSNNSSLISGGRTTWTYEMDIALLNSLKKLRETGFMNEQLILRDATWHEVSNSVNHVGHSQVDREQCRQHWSKVFKSHWKAWKQHRSCFAASGRDPNGALYLSPSEGGGCMEDPAVEEAYFSRHRRFLPFRHSKGPRFSEWMDFFMPEWEATERGGPDGSRNEQGTETGGVGEALVVSSHPPLLEKRPRMADPPVISLYTTPTSTNPPSRHQTPSSPGPATSPLPTPRPAVVGPSHSEPEPPASVTTATTTMPARAPDPLLQSPGPVAQPTPSSMSESTLHDQSKVRGQVRRRSGSVLGSSTPPPINAIPRTRHQPQLEPEPDSDLILTFVGPVACTNRDTACQLGEERLEAVQMARDGRLPSLSLRARTVLIREAPVLLPELRDERGRVSRRVLQPVLDRFRDQEEVVDWLAWAAAGSREDRESWVRDRMTRRCVAP